MSSCYITRYWDSIGFRKHRHVMSNVPTLNQTTSLLSKTTTPSNNFQSYFLNIFFFSFSVHFSIWVRSKEALVMAWLVWTFNKVILWSRYFNFIVTIFGVLPPFLWCEAFMSTFHRSCFGVFYCFWLELLLVLNVNYVAWNLSWVKVKVGKRFELYAQQTFFVLEWLVGWTSWSCIYCYKKLSIVDYCFFLLTRTTYLLTMCLWVNWGYK